MEAKGIRGLCGFVLPRPARATRIPAPVIVTSSFSTIRIVFSTSFLALVFLEIPGTQAPRQSGIFLRTSSGLTLGRARTLLDCRFSLGLLRFIVAEEAQVKSLGPPQPHTSPRTASACLPLFPHPSPLQLS